jgi:hypothetical protein
LHQGEFLGGEPTVTACGPQGVHDAVAILMQRPQLGRSLGTAATLAMQGSSVVTVLRMLRPTPEEPLCPVRSRAFLLFIGLAAQS